MKKYVLIGIILLAIVLRFYKLNSIPPSLYWDEASLGYNAYSILLTGRDEHERFLPVTNFAAFGDYKPPGYIYAAVPFIALFGLNEFAIRFPAAFFGVLTVLLTYLIARKIFEDEAIALLSAFFLAISPWHLQFSRGAFEANLGLFFSTLGIYLFLKFAKDKPYWLFFSGLSFLAAMYTFTGQRLFVPFILLVLAIQFRKQILTNIKLVIVTTVVAIFLFWPLIKFATGTIEGRLRFNEVTIFKDLNPIDESRRYQALDNYKWWANVIHNRRFFYVNEYLKHYFDAFNPSFLFIRGDVNPRLSVQEIGELYYFDLILILAGIYFLFAKNYKYRFLILGWLIVSPLGPATARETPHALRMIHILPTFQIIAAIGIYHLYDAIKFKRIFTVSSVLIFAISLFYYFHMYYIHWPRNYSDQWQYGYKQAVEVVKSYYSEVDHIYVTKSLGRPYIYFLLYTKYDPNLYWQTAKVTRDEFYFIDVESFDKFLFSDNPNQYSLTGKTLYVVRPGELSVEAQKVASINDLSGKQVFEIGIVSR